MLQFLFHNLMKSIEIKNEKVCIIKIFSDIKFRGRDKVTRGFDKTAAPAPLVDDPRGTDRGI